MQAAWVSDSGPSGRLHQSNTENTQSKDMFPPSLSTYSDSNGNYAGL